MFSGSLAALHSYYKTFQTKVQDLFFTISVKVCRTGFGGNKKAIAFWAMALNFI